MESLFWIVVGFICSQIVLGVWFYTNTNDIKTEHERLKAELGQRLFVKTPVGNFDLKQILGALITYHKVKVEGTSAIKIVKDEYLNRKDKK